MKTRSPDVTEDLVPLADRLRYLRGFRILVCVVVAAAALSLGAVQRAAGLDVLLAMIGWMALTGAAETGWRLSPGRALWLFGAMLVVDAVLLVWLGYVAIPEPTPLRLLLMLHVVTVSLLASYRTGLKLAIWHSLLLLSAYHAREAGVLEAGPVPQLGDTGYGDLIATMFALGVLAIATAAFSAANERELRRRRYDLEALGRLSLELERRGDPQSVAERLCRAAADDFDAVRVAVFGIEDDHAELLHAHGEGALVDVPDTVLGAGDILHRAIIQQRPLLVSHLGDDQAVATALPEAQNVALIPMRAEGRTLGVLVCEHGLRSGSRMERRVLAMLERYASHASLALSNSWLIDELERSARIDALTGIANRRVFDSELARELGRASRTDEPVSLLLLDIDHFKRLNDNFGHVAGDAALAELAKRLRGAVRLGDTLARYGGEEFALVLPGLDEAQAADAAERLREISQGLDLDTEITVSIGVATAPVAGRDPMTLVAAADQALYAAKAAGRNRVARSSQLVVKAAG